MFFFRRIFKYARTISLQCSGVVILCFVRVFYFQTNYIGSALKRNVHQALDSDSNLCSIIVFMVSLTFGRYSNCYLFTVGLTTGFWSDRYGLESQPSPTFFSLNNTTENRDTPPPTSYAWNFLVPELFSKTEASPTTFFGTVRQKLSRKQGYSPLSMKFSDNRNSLNFWRVANNIL